MLSGWLNSCRLRRGEKNIRLPQQAEVKAEDEIKIKKSNKKTSRWAGLGVGDAGAVRNLQLQRQRLNKSYQDAEKK